MQGTEEEERGKREERSTFAACESCSAFGLSSFDIALGQPARRLDQLHDVDELLGGHDRTRHAGNDPRPEAVHLVGARQLERAGAIGTREEARGRGVRRTAGLRGRAW